MTAWPLLLAEAAHHGGGLYEMSIHDKALVACTFVVVLFILVFALLAQSGIGLVPQGWGAVFEHNFDWLDDVARSFMGPQGRAYVPLTMSLFMFILISNWSGLIPWPRFIVVESAQQVHETNIEEGRPVMDPEKANEVELSWEAPTASFSTTLALAVVSFLAFNIYGLKKSIFPPAAHGAHDHSHAHGHSHDQAHGHDHAHDHGGHGHEAHHNPGGLAGLWQWIAHFWQPVPALARSFEGGTKALIPFLFVLFLGLNIVEELARLMSLSIRLYGNIFGEHQVKSNLIAAIYDYTIGPNGGLAQMGKGDTLSGFGYLGLGAMLWGTSLFATCLGALAGFVQGMVFAMLTLSYIAHAVADEH